MLDAFFYTVTYISKHDDKEEGSTAPTYVVESFLSTKQILILLKTFTFMQLQCAMPQHHPTNPNGIPLHHPPYGLHDGTSVG